MFILKAMGTYDVAAAEGPDPHNRSMITCQVNFLDDKKANFKIAKNSKGHILLDLTFDFLELLERDFFGLTYTITDHGRLVQRWLDPSKQIIKHFKHSSPYNFIFGVKFYVPDPVILTEEYTRYQFFLQLRRDLAEGQLIVSRDVAAHLSGLYLQSELGPYEPSEHQPGYTNEFKFIPKQTPEFEQLAHEWHTKLGYLAPSGAELEYINICRQSDFYGSRLRPCRNESAQGISISVAANGISEFSEKKLTSLRRWDLISKITFKKKVFNMQLKSYAVEQRAQVSYYFQCMAEAKAFWQHAVACHAFFRIHDAAAATGSIDSVPFGNNSAPTITVATPNIIQRMTSKRSGGLFRWFSFRRQRDYDLDSSLGGLNRTMSTIMDLRNKNKAFDQGFQRLVSLPLLIALAT
ncbi:Tyrosine-protein phosphatase non-receptor type 3 [Cichlidogyrus casuarinus]|uniref:Tyrosine-protein phosphatase non-receptor type 3 n=1 Tax=Cichlidogyrus casuarinus TaxID=1844966 RepID=A0ABD2Q8P6_9PLAT